jgi:hypothetical protein
LPHYCQESWIRELSTEKHDSTVGGASPELLTPIRLMLHTAVLRKKT